MFDFCCKFGDEIYNRHFLRNPEIALGSNPGALDHTNRLLPELLQRIFVMAKINFPSIALVNRQFKLIADDITASHMFREVIFSGNLFGEKDYLHFWPGINPGKEPPLPYCAISDYEEGDLLTFVTDSIFITGEDGKVTEEPLTLMRMSTLGATANSEHKIGLGKESWDRVLVDPRTSSGKYWSLIKRQIRGLDASSLDQIVRVKKQDDATCASGFIDGFYLAFAKTATNVSNLGSTVLSIITRKVKTGEQCLVNDALNKNCDAIRLRDAVDLSSIILSANPLALIILEDSSFGRPYPNIGVAVERKFFGS